MFDDSAFLNDAKNGAQVLKIMPTNAAGGEEDRLNASDPQKTSLSQIFKPSIVLGENVRNAYGYLNLDGGWVDSKKGVEIAIQAVRDLGGQIHSGKEVSELLKTDSRTRGVKCKDGSEFEADIVVIATG